MSLLRSRGESDLSRVRPRRRCGAVNRGCTRTSHSLLSSIRSSARVTCRQSSSAPQPLSVERARPRERLLVDRAGVLIERAAELVDRHSDERVLANVQTNNDPSDRLLPLGGHRRADRPHSRQLPGSYQVTLGGLGKAAATQRWQVSPRATFGNRVSRRQPESLLHSRRHSPTMTVSSGMSPGEGWTVS